MKLQIAGTIWNWDISHSKLLPALQDYAGTQKPITIAFSSGTDLEAPGYYAIPHQFMMVLVSASCSMKLENYIGQLVLDSHSRSVHIVQFYSWVQNGPLLWIPTKMVQAT